MNGQNLTKFCIHIIIDKIYVGIVKHHILAILAFVNRCLDVIIYLGVYIRNFMALSSLCSRVGRFLTQSGGKPHDRFSRDEAHSQVCYDNLYVDHVLGHW